MNTYAALLSRINVAAAYQLATQQDTNKLLSVIANSQAVGLKAQRDSYADGINIDIHVKENLMDRLAWASEGGREALSNYEVSKFTRF